MAIMAKVQGQNGCSVLTALDTSPHYLIVPTTATMFIITMFRLIMQTSGIIIGMLWCTVQVSDKYIAYM